jgi:hypothetical protein
MAVEWHGREMGTAGYLWISLKSCNTAFRYFETGRSSILKSKKKQRDTTEALIWAMSSYATTHVTSEVIERGVLRRIFFPHHFRAPQSIFFVPLLQVSNFMQGLKFLTCFNLLCLYNNLLDALFIFTLLSYYTSICFWPISSPSSGDRMYIRGKW